MAERRRIEAIFKLYGCIGDDGVEADTGTIYWLTTTMGLDSTTELWGDKAMIDSLIKSLVTAAKDITIPEERRPRNTMKVRRVFTTVVGAVRYYAGRGVPLTIEMLEMMHHRKAVNFFDRLRKAIDKADVDGDAKIDLPVLPATIAINSVQFHDWMDGVKRRLRATQSVDGVGTAHATIRENVAPLDWADVDVTEQLAVIADKISPLGGMVHHQDQTRLHAALSDACKYAGQSFVDKHQLDMDGRSCWLDIRKHFYPPKGIEIQVNEIEKRIRTTYFKGPDSGHSYERVAGIHRKMHVRLNNLGRSWTETKKVITLIDAMKYRNHKMDSAIVFIENDHEDRYNNFENAVDVLKHAIPIAKDPLRSLKAVETAKGGDDDYPKEWDDAGRFLTDAQRKSEAQVVPFGVYKEYSPAKRARITSDRKRFGITVGKKPNAKAPNAKWKHKEKDKNARFKPDPRRELASIKAQIASLKASMTAGKAIANDGNYSSESDSSNPGAIKRGGRKRGGAAEASSKHRKKSN
jgi:hypothetical protein